MLVGLVVGGQVVEVQHADLEYRVVGAHAEVGYRQTGYHLRTRILAVIDMKYDQSNHRLWLYNHTSPLYSRMDSEIQLRLRSNAERNYFNAICMGCCLNE